MSCTCTSQMEERGRQKFSEKYGDAVEGEISASLAGVAMVSEDLSRLEYRPSIPIVMSGLVFNKRRTSTTYRKMTIQAIASFCPFCGQRLTPGGDDAAPTEEER